MKLQYTSLLVLKVLCC